MSDTDQASKTEEATPRKLEQSREKGDVAKTQDLAPLMALAFAAGALAILGGWLVRNMANALLPFIAHPEQIPLEGAGGVIVARMAIMAAAPVLAAVLATAALGGMIGNLAQHGLLFTPDKLKPDFKKVSPLAGFKRIFGPDGMVQFLKSVSKILAVAGVAYLVLKPHLHQFQTLSALDPAAMLPFSATILRKLIFAVIALMLAIAGADWLWQKHRFLKKQMMSRHEIKEEYKQTDGDPLIKAKLRQMRHDRARRRMMAAVPTATVVVMNPTHYAVALKYEAGGAAAPQCVAKGLDAVALRIRATAEEAGVPVIEDPPLARALYAAVEIDDTIPPAHFEAVAKIIGFIMGARSAPPARARPMR
ncbi:MAG: flagellar biosynthesis protein FlhB [Phenylobacterium sp.]|uniref:flagellar biosynthesis protein FlhB n=1 Tax=Phenylobacterium sp. TaxID=1871053 RepID=UPI002723E3B6|nr:flagellar biosynthesis protein FlhB [Phenylobacterium sp.]MDO8901980.1 flagellar biosynthesis protein FlhB [Phenylobacterium sp.]MDP2212961.1 flagellar biosynthesis protein FlhB [Phenylobacterium sp.]